MAVLRRWKDGPYNIFIDVKQTLKKYIYCFSSNFAFFLFFPLSLLCAIFVKMPLGL